MCNSGRSLFQGGRTAVAMERFEHFSDELTEGQRNVRTEEE